MNMIDEKQIRMHVLIVAWLNILGSVIAVAVAALLFFFLVGIGVAVDEPIATRVLSLVAITAGGFMVVLAIPGIVAGIGLLMRKTWGRVLGMIVGLLSLINIPIGTVVGGYTLLVLLQDSANDYFAEERVESATIVPAPS